MPIPAGVETVTVTSGEPLTLPDGTIYKGHIRFVAPDLAVVPSDDFTLGGEAVAELVDGEFSITLVAPDATNINPTGWTYTVIGEFTNAPDWTTFALLTKDSPNVILSDVIEAEAIDPAFSTIYLRRDGGTMTGDLILSGNPTVALEAAPKQYVDSQAAAAQAAAQAASAAESVSLAGDTMTGALVLSGDPAVALGAATKQYVESYLTDTIGIDTGVLWGADLNDSATVGSVDLAAGAGIVVDYVANESAPTITLVPISAQTIAISNLSAPVTWLMMSSAGTIVQQTTRPTNAQRRTHLQLGVVVVSGGDVIIEQTLHQILSQPLNQLYDLMDAIGPFNISGNTMSAAGANLQLAKESGTVFSRSFNHFANDIVTNDPHVSSVAAQNPVSMRYVTQTPAAPVAPVTSVIPGSYDVGGVITAVPGGANTSTIQRVFLFPENDVANQIVIQYGQTTYASLDAAVAAIGTTAYVKNPVNESAVLIGYVVLTRTCTDLSNSTQARIIMASRFSENPAGVSTTLALALALTGGTMTGTINATLANAATVALGSLVTGDTFDRFRRYASGLQEWGPGNAARDTNLYRLSANVLATDDKFVAAAGIGVGNSAAATTPGSVVRRIEVFDATGASLGFIPVYSSIT